MTCTLHSKVQCPLALNDTSSTVKDVKKKSQGPPGNKIRTEDFVDSVRDRIKASPTKSVCKLAKEMIVDEKTIRMTVQIDLGMKSRVRSPRQLLTEKNKADRVERRTALLNWLKHHPSAIKVFSDKKPFKVDQCINRRNICFISATAAEVPPVLRMKHPATVMALGVMASSGK